MKLLNYLVALLLLMQAGGFMIYFLGYNTATVKLDEVSRSLSDSGKIENVRTYIENDEELSVYMEEAKTAEESSLPFHTTGQATRVLIKKVGVTELNELRKEAQSGTMTPQEAVQKLEGKLTEEEMLALKVIAYKEIYNQQ